VDLKTLGKSQLLIIGASEGSTTVWLDEDAGVRTLHVNVRKGEGCSINGLAKLFPCGSTLEMKMVGDRIYLDGEASSFEEWSAAFAVVKEYPGVVVLGHLKPDVVEHTFVEADAALMRAGLGRLRWARAGESVHLAGERAVDDAAKIAALETQWRPTLEMVLSRPPVRPWPTKP
jgi:pilus assembly protein CpaC